jgi:regulator of protease activity HflC (stomatin/prohibitin superfamily)
VRCVRTSPPGAPPGTANRVRQEGLVDNLGSIVAVIIVLAVILFLIYLAVRVVNEYQRLVVFRFGRTSDAGVKGPGLVFLIPVVDRPVSVDLREQFIEVPSQTTITRDNAPINVDFLIYWRIVDP